jgi:DNA-binding NarL/FixJ family response regulator
MLQRLKVLIVDDSDTANGLKAYLTHENSYDIAITETLYGFEMLATDKGVIFDVILLDMKFRNEKYAGIEKLTEIQSKMPKTTKIIIFSSYTDRDLIIKSKSVGASGYIFKNESDAYDMVKRNLKWILNNENKSFENCSSETIRDILNQNKYIDISDIQVKILFYLKDNNSFKEVANKLSIDEYKVGNELKAISKKWNTANKLPNLLIQAFKNGLFDANE